MKPPRPDASLLVAAGLALIVLALAWDVIRTGPEAPEALSPAGPAGPDRMLPAASPPPAALTRRASLSPPPFAFEVGRPQTFALDTDIASPPGVWVGVNYEGDSGNLDTGEVGCPGGDNDGVALANGGEVTITACAEGEAQVRLYVGQDLLRTYRVTASGSDAKLPASAPVRAELSPKPSEIEVGRPRVFTLSTDAPNPPGVWVGVNYDGGVGKFTIGGEGCPGRPNSGVAIGDGEIVAVRACEQGLGEIRVYRAGELLRAYAVTASEER